MCFQSFRKIIHIKTFNLWESFWRTVTIVVGCFGFYQYIIYYIYLSKFITASNFSQKKVLCAILSQNPIKKLAALSLSHKVNEAIN